jgi:hypothetical protein
VRKHLLMAGATLATIISFVPACAGSPTAANASPSTAACVDAGAPHHAYVVVEHLDAAHTTQRCVGFSGDSIDAPTLMDRSGIEYQTQTFSFGKAVCQVDGEPAQYTQCFASSGPNWTLYVDANGAWSVAQSGYTQVTLHDGEALGWRYTADQSASPPPMPTPVGG